MRIAVYRETAAPVDGESGEPTALLEAVRLAVEHLRPEEAVWVRRGNGLNEKLAGKDCLVVVAPHLTARDCQLLEQLSSPPVVVVTLDPRAAALDLCRVRLHGVVDQNTENIEFAVRQAVTSSTFERAARVAEEHPRLSAGLREWLARTLRNWPPYRSVKESVEPIAGTPFALGAAWRSGIGRSSPKEWLGRIQLARGLSIKGHATWSLVAWHLKITLRTLERLAYRTNGRTLTELASNLVKFQEESERYLAEILGSEGP